MSTQPAQRQQIPGIVVILVATVLGAIVAATLVVGLTAGTTASSSSSPAVAAEPYVDVSTMCSAMTTYPDKRYTIATEAIPPMPGSGLAGTAASYRRAADLIDAHCPSNYQQSELLRGMARIYAPTS